MRSGRMCKGTPPGRKQGDLPYPKRTLKASRKCPPGTEVSNVTVPQRRSAAKPWSERSAAGAVERSVGAAGP